MGLAIIQCDMCYSHQQNICKHCLAAPLGGFSIEKSGVVKPRFQSIHKSFGTWINVLETTSLRLELLAGQ
jgi:hypothetical protein